MDKQDNLEINFSLKGFSSIQIGVYILIAAYVIKSILSDFSDGNFLGLSSEENVLIVVTTIIFFTLLFSFFALFFKSKRNAKKQQYKLWNKKAIASFWIILIAFFVIFGLLILAFNLGYANFITPIFLIFYGILLFAYHNKERKQLLIISGVCLLFAIICFLIPNYWYSSLVILGIAHITYGIMTR